MISLVPNNSSKMPLISKSSSWQSLSAHAAEINSSKFHLKDLLNDPIHCKQCQVEFDNITLDYSRQKVNKQTIDLLYKLASEAKLKEKIQSLAEGRHLNTTEDRAVGHIALRADRSDVYNIDGHNAVTEILAVREKIAKFSEDVRSGKFKGYTGKTLKNVIAVGIGGSYLGANFVAEALAVEPSAAQAAAGRQLRFLANVDPVAVTRATAGLHPEETLVIVISKTFTTRETMLNARTMRTWLVSVLGDEKAVAKHMVAVSTNEKAVKEFGIDPNNAFAFWDWVGGRYSVTSAVGLLPLAIHYGNDQVEAFLRGARSVDKHFLSAPLEGNLPVILGLLGVWNSSFLKYGSRALICYSEAMHKLAPHIQQVDMESNGKSVTLDNCWVDFPTGEVDFGEPGTNAQHSFFQLIHQGQIVPVDFVGFINSQTPIDLTSQGDDVPNHTELMCNFFAQPDALALGKNAEELRKEGVSDELIPHRTFTGNRPSTVILLSKLTAYEIGQILALYEHRTAVQGFIWNINSFDQWGVELGKKLADKVRKELKGANSSKQITAFNPSTNSLITKFLQHSKL